MVFVWFSSALVVLSRCFIVVFPKSARTGRCCGSRQWPGLSSKFPHKKKTAMPEIAGDDLLI